MGVVGGGRLKCDFKAKTWRSDRSRCVRDRGNCQCKGPEARVCLASSREACAAGAEQVGGGERVGGGDGRKTGLDLARPCGLWRGLRHSPGVRWEPRSVLNRGGVCDLTWVFTGSLGPHSCLRSCTHLCPCSPVCRPESQAGPWDPRIISQVQILALLSGPPAAGVPGQGPELWGDRGDLTPALPLPPVFLLLPGASAPAALPAHRG